MREIILELCFACCECEERTGATVHCCGKGMKDWPRSYAAANIRCPHCGVVNTIVFSVGSGRVVQVSPADEERLTRPPVPSRN
jgi:hypothetical protein